MCAALAAALGPAAAASYRPLSSPAGQQASRMLQHLAWFEWRATAQGAVDDGMVVYGKGTIGDTDNVLLSVAVWLSVWQRSALSSIRQGQRQRTFRVYSWPLNDA